MTDTQLPIGVFDSGVGGLTVLRALQDQLPHESFLYLGDTARLPYGTKSPETIIRYARQATQLLLNRGVKAIVIACNTVSALALPVLQQEFDRIAWVGVIEPGASAACKASSNGHIAIIATEATVHAQSYLQAIKRIRPDVEVISQACSLFVALAEEGWLEGPITEAIAERYLQPLLSQQESARPDCLVLGCTHFPALIQTIKKVAGMGIRVVDSAQTTALVVAKMLAQTQLSAAPASDLAKVQFLVTDDPQRFIRVAGQFLGMNLLTAEVELVDLSFCYPEGNR